MANKPTQRTVAPNIIERTYTNGSKSFVARVRIKGHPSQAETFNRLTDAKKWQRHTTANIEAGRVIPVREAKRTTFSDLVERYISDVLPAKSPHQQKVQRGHLKWWTSELGAYTLQNVTPALITKCRDKLSKTSPPRGGDYSPTTVRHYLGTLSHVFSVAVSDWQLLDKNPLQSIRKPRATPGRVRFLSEDERLSLLEACKKSPHPYLYSIVVLALHTGMRRGEILSLTWKSIDFQRKRIILEKTKNQDRRSVPLSDLALERLQVHAKIRRIDSDLVFPSKAGGIASIYKAWNLARKASGVTNFKFHDIRHTAASYLAMSGASLLEIAEVLGHRTLQMVKRYAHLADSHTAQVVERMTQSICD